MPMIYTVPARVEEEEGFFPPTIVAGSRHQSGHFFRKGLHQSTPPSMSAIVREETERGFFLASPFLTQRGGKWNERSPGAT